MIFLIAFTTFAFANEKLYRDYNEDNYRSCNGINSIIQKDKIDFSLLNAAIFFRTNEIRVQNGLPPLAYKEELSKAAIIHADDMVENDFIAHINPNNKTRKTPDDRAKLAGITNPFIAENIATHFAIQYRANTEVRVVDGVLGIFRYPNEEQDIQAQTYISFAVAVVDIWMKSEGHRAIILNKDAVELGIGTAFYHDKNNYNIPKIMTVQNFQYFEKSKD